MRIMCKQNTYVMFAFPISAYTAILYGMFGCVLLNGWAFVLQKTVYKEETTI